MKKCLSVVVTIALLAVLLPAAVAQQNQPRQSASAAQTGEGEWMPGQGHWHPSYHRHSAGDLAITSLVLKEGAVRFTEEGPLTFVAKGKRGPSTGPCYHATIRVLDWLNKMTLPSATLPVHQVTGRPGEDDAYVRKRGYVMVARIFRSPRRRGENQPDRVGQRWAVFYWGQDRHSARSETGRNGCRPGQAAPTCRGGLRILSASPTTLLPVAWPFDVVSV